MEPLLYVMAIMGCADGATGCVEARRSGYRFASKAQCQRAIEEQLLQSTDLSFPTIAARCMTERQYIAETRDRPKARMMLAKLEPFAG